MVFLESAGSVKGMIHSVQEGAGSEDSLPTPFTDESGSKESIPGSAGSRPAGSLRRNSSQGTGTGFLFSKVKRT
jgi:hypothetical protein